MSYQITFKDRTSVIVSTSRGDKVKELWFNDKKDTPIDIDGNAYLIGSISKVESVADSTAHNSWADEDHQLPAIKQCSSEFSIQNEINKIIRFEHPNQWAKLIQDTKYRDKLRIKLRRTSAVWCDDRVGECACEGRVVTAV